MANLDLKARLAQARAMLDVLSTRIGALPASDQAGLQPELTRLRDRWSEAQQAYDLGRATGGKLRAEDEQNSRAVLDEVQEGLLQLVTEMNTRFAGQPPTPSP